MSHTIHPRHARLSSADRARHIAGLGTLAALDLVRGLHTPSSIQTTIDLEQRCKARSAVLDALKHRMQLLRRRT